MAISDKTRKALWAKSGNRCLLCRIELVQEVDKATSNLIIGEECHIVSSKSTGPRGNINFESDYDHYDNLVLLCANDHKRVDELTQIYTIEKLVLFKAEHEGWVRSTLERDVTAFANDKLNVKSLPKIKTGRDIIDVINGAHFFEFDHDDLSNEEEANEIGGFLQSLQDWGEIIPDIGFAEVSKLGIQLNKEIDKINQKGFIVFGLKRRLRLRDEKNEDKGIFISATVIVVKEGNPSINGDFLLAKFPSKLSFG